MLACAQSDAIVGAHIHGLTMQEYLQTPHINEFYFPARRLVVFQIVFLAPLSFEAMEPSVSGEQSAQHGCAHRRLFVDPFCPIHPQSRPDPVSV